MPELKGILIQGKFYVKKRLGSKDIKQGKGHYVPGLAQTELCSFAHLALALESRTEGASGAASE